MDRIMDALADFLTEVEHSSSATIAETMDEVRKYRRMPGMARSFMVDVLEIYRIANRKTGE